MIFEKGEESKFIGIDFYFVKRKYWMLIFRFFLDNLSQNRFYIC